jgi:hypothetical protein
MSPGEAAWKKDIKWLYRAPWTPPKTGLYLAPLIVAPGIALLSVETVAVGTALWFLGRWGVRYDDRWRRRRGLPSEPPP